MRDVVYMGKEDCELGREVGVRVGSAWQRGMLLCDRRRICRNIRLLWECMGITKKELCERVGVPQSSMVSYMSGRTLPGLDRLGSIAKGLGVGLDRLLEGDVEGDMLEGGVGIEVDGCDEGVGVGLKGEGVRGVLGMKGIRGSSRDGYRVCMKRVRENGYDIGVNYYRYRRYFFGMVRREGLRDCEVEELFHDALIDMFKYANIGEGDEVDGCYMGLFVFYARRVLGLSRQYRYALKRKGLPVSLGAGVGNFGRDGCDEGRFGVDGSCGGSCDGDGAYLRGMPVVEGDIERIESSVLMSKIERFLASSFSKRDCLCYRLWVLGYKRREIMREFGLDRVEDVSNLVSAMNNRIRKEAALKGWM